MHTINYPWLYLGGITRLHRSQTLELFELLFMQRAICRAFHRLNPGLVSLSYLLIFLKCELSFRQTLDRCTVGLTPDHLSPCPTPLISPLP